MNPTEICNEQNAAGMQKLSDSPTLLKPFVNRVNMAPTPKWADIDEGYKKGYIS